MEKTLVILKPCTVGRAIVGEVIGRFEKKGFLGRDENGCLLPERGIMRLK